MAQGKEYYAFISYKREDEKWAKWLQDKLEYYKFPTNLNGRTNLPKHIRPTFRDVTDLKPGLLSEEINNALCNSEWLIVVCSPRSAKSPWVCKEAQTFIDLGRADHIIPFVIEGNPFSNDAATECYPEALLNLTGSKELLAANINEMGRDAAAVKVIAQMFGLKFDTLWQRHEREKKKRSWSWICFSIIISLIGLSVGLFFIRQNRLIEHQKMDLLFASEKLRDDSEKLANHMLRIQKDSILLKQNSDSLKRANIELYDAHIEMSSINKDLKIKQVELVCNLAIEFLNQGKPTDSRITICRFLKNNHGAVGYYSQLEFLLRQLYFLNNGIEKRFLEHINIQKWEEFVSNSATRVLFFYNHSFYIDYDCNLWEYNTLNHKFSLIFKGERYIGDLAGGIEAYSPTYKKIILRLPEGELAVVHIPSNTIKKISKSSFGKVYMDKDASLLLVKGIDEEDNYFLWDIANDKMIGKDIDNNGFEIKVLSEDTIELLKDTVKSVVFYSFQNYQHNVHYSPNNSPVSNDYELILDNGFNNLEIYIGKEDTVLRKPTKDPDWYHFKDLKMDFSNRNIYIPELPNLKIPSQIHPMSYILSMSQRFAIIGSSRFSLYLLDSVTGNIIKRISDYDIMKDDIYTIAWSKDEKYIGFSTFEKMKGDKKYTVSIINTSNGALIMKFESVSSDLFFSEDGTKLLINDNVVPFPSYNQLVYHFTKMY